MPRADRAGTLRYIDEELSFSCVSAVATSRITRKQGLAGRLTVTAIAEDVEEGALVSGLGMFEKGYYDRLGFGTGSYEHWVTFTPSQLNVDVKPRIPRRIGTSDFEKFHHARHIRGMRHGAVCLTSPNITHADMLWAKDGFGLGYIDERAGNFTHLVYFSARENVEHGPYSVHFAVFSTREEFLELMALLKSWEEDVYSIRMREPPGIQLQALLKQPFKYFGLTEKGKYKTRADACAYWQMRILDLPACLEGAHLHWGKVKFNLELSDPIEDFFEGDAHWRGCAGEYVVTLGKDSSAKRGIDNSLPTLSATVNAFTRLWLGVMPTSSLAITDSLAASDPSLLTALDTLFAPLPTLHPDWDF